MDGPTSAELASIRLTVNSFLPDTCTNSRTHATVPCRVASDTREERVHGLPSIIRLRRFVITMPDQTDCLTGDQLAVTGMETYAIVSVTVPQSYSVETEVYCVALFTGPGGNLPVQPNATVEFRNPDNQGTSGRITAGVYIYPASVDALVFAGALQFDWAVMMPLDIAFTDGSLVNSDDEIRWVRLGIRGNDPTKVVGASISKPIKHLDPVPFQIAYFKETAV